MPVKPLVPEVSLLFDQDKSRSFHITSTPEENKQKGKEEYKLEIPHSIFPQNQLESYNSWKAKNAQALHTITGSLNGAETKKQTSGSKMSSDYRNKHTNPNNAVFSVADSVTSPPIYRHPVPKSVYTDQVRVGVNSQSQAQGSEEFALRQMGRPTFNQCNDVVENNPFYRPYPQNDSDLQYRVGEVIPQMKHYQNAHYIHEKNAQPALPPALHDPYTAKKAYIISNSHATHEPARKLQERDIHERKSCHTNQGYCECRHENNKAAFKNRIESDCGREEDRAHNIGLQCKDSKAVSPLDIAQINNQTVMELYKIINVQNEQILMLQQQVKQVLQIHLDCDRKVVNEKPLCHNCPCEQKPNRNSKNDSNKHECNCNESEDLVQHKASCSVSANSKTPKRSVGIMTTPFKDDFHENSATDSDDSNERRKANEPPKGKKSRQKQKRIKSSPTTCKNSKKRPERDEQKGKAQYISPHEK